jgi:hypothetical protein
MEQINTTQNTTQHNMKNTYQIKSDFELCERIECLHQIKHLLSSCYAHVFDESEQICISIQNEIKHIKKELEKRDY